MIFGQLCSYLKDEAAADRDTVVKPPETGPYFSSSFGLRVALALGSFSRVAALFFTPRAAITIPASVSQISLTDGSTSTLRVYEPWSLWVGDTFLQRRSTPWHLWRNEWVQTTAGTPYYWVEGQDGTVYFDRPTLATPTAGYVRGLYYHPTIVSDQDQVLIPDEKIRLFTAYCLAELTEAVAGDEVGIARLQRRDSRAAQAVAGLRGEQMAVLLSGDDPYALGGYLDGPFNY